MPLSPTAPIEPARMTMAKIVQKPALKLSTNPSEDSEGYLSCTDDVTTEMMPSPTAWPKSETILNTAPASDCVSSGNTSDTTRSPTVKRMSALIGWRSCCLLVVAYMHQSKHEVD